MEQTTALVKVEEFKELISKAPVVLSENQNSCSKAIEKGNELISLAENGMNDVIDTQISSYIEKAKKTVINMTEKRKPFTQIMTMISKEFTTLESSIKPTIEQCQAYRDSYATQKMNERREAERLASIKLAKDNEAIQIIQNYKILNADNYINYLSNFRQSKTDWFNALTIETIDGEKDVINQFDNNLVVADFDFKGLIAVPELDYHSEAEYLELIKSLSLSFPSANLAKFKNDCATFIREMFDMIPSKKQQLEELEAARKKAIKEAAEAAERQRLADLAAAEAKAKAEQEADLAKKAELEKQAKAEAAKAELERQQNAEAEAKRKAEADKAAEDEKIRQEEEKAKRDAEIEAERIRTNSEAQIEATAATASAMVDNQATLFSEAPKVKEGYNIKILNQAAYLLLAQFWFENEGKNITIEKIESMTFSRIKTFCEKWAAINEDFIESKLVVYEPVYKAR